MSRSGYTDDMDDPLAYGRWRQAVKRALEGARGQALLRDLVVALDAMESKRLYPGSFSTPAGEFCALGALAARRGTRVDDLGDQEDECDARQVGQRFGIARAMAAEIMYVNDEYAADLWRWVEVCGPMRPIDRHRRHVVRVPNDDHPAERWRNVRAWAVEQLKAPAGERA